MFWDKISPLYDIFENIYNGKVYTGVEYHVVDGRMPCAIAVITKAQRFIPEYNDLPIIEQLFCYKSRCLSAPGDFLNILIMEREK